MESKNMAAGASFLLAKTLDQLSSSYTFRPVVNGTINILSKLFFFFFLVSVFFFLIFMSVIMLSVMRNDCEFACGVELVFVFFSPPCVVNSLNDWI